MLINKRYGSREWKLVDEYNSELQANYFSFMPETKDVLSLCFSLSHLHPDVCRVVFFVCLLFLSKLYMRDFWIVCFGVRACVSAFAFCSLFIARLCVCVCVFSLVCVPVHAAVSGAESLMKFNSLTWSFSLSRPQRKQESERERKKRMLCDGKEVVKWTTAVAIETLLATQHCCYSACLLANFRPVVSMNISVGSHFSGAPCAYNKLYI